MHIGHDAMRELDVREIELVSGGSAASDCADTIINYGTVAGGVGATIGAIGGPGGAAIGFGLGALFGGGWAAKNHAKCQVK